MPSKKSATAQPGTAAQVRESLGALSNREKAEFFPRFFKSDPDNQSEGDLFLGVTVPQQRAVAKTFASLPLGEIESAVNKISSDKQVVVHCRSGKRSADAIKILEKKYGFTNLYNLQGGILAWADKVDHAMAKY
mgnify:CR=1 FL=1